MALKAVSAPLGSPVGGSGTVGTIPVWGTTTTTLTDSPLTVSGSNVTGAGAIRATGTSAGAPAFTGSDTDSGMYFPAANQVRFSTNGALAIAIDASQNVGIGTASPTSTADIFGLQTNTSGTNASAPTGTLRLNFNGAPAAGQYGSSLVFSQQWFSGSPTSYVAVGQITGVKIAGSGFYGGGLAFWYGNNTVLAEGMRLDNNGNVGIGTASPNAILSVYQASSPTISIWNSSNYTRLSTNVHDFYLDAGLGGSAGAVIFRRSSSATESMRIDSSGNVYAASGTTGMTNGFFYIPAAAGAPSGTPTAVSGRVPMYYDTTNNNFYVYNGGWKKVLLA